MISMILLLPGLRQNKQFRRISSMCLDLCRENDLDWFNSKEFTNKDAEPSVPKAGNQFYYQVFISISIPIYSHFDSILNEDQLQSNSYKSFKQLPVLWCCLISRKFLELNSSCEGIDIYAKLFLSACNAFNISMQKPNKE